MAHNCAKEDESCVNLFGLLKHPHGGSQLPVTPAPKDLVLSSGLSVGTYSHMYIHPQRSIYINPK